MHGYLYEAPTEQKTGEPEQIWFFAEDEDAALAFVLEHGGAEDWVQARIWPDVDEPEQRLVNVSLAPRRGPVCSPNDLYAMEPLRVFKQPWVFSDFFEPEVNTDQIPDEANLRVEARTLADPYIDGERCCTLMTLWLDDRPFGILQLAGRGGRDHREGFVTDEAVYWEALAYLLSLQVHEEREVLWNSIPADQPSRELTSFYSHADVLMSRPENQSEETEP